jgi:hypothetical protein
MSVFKLFKVLAFFGLMFLISCGPSSQKADLQKNEKDYKSIAEAKYKKNITYVFNSSKNKVLCLHQTRSTASFPQSRLQFFVYDLEKNETVYEDELNGGSVAWLNDQQLEIQLSPEMVIGDEPPENFKYVYDLEKKKKIN